MCAHGARVFRIFSPVRVLVTPCSDPVEQGTPEEGSCKNQKIEKFGSVAVTTRVMNLRAVQRKITA